MTNIITISDNLHQKWLIKLAQTWPSILEILLDQEKGESLERLQLAFIELELISRAEKLEETNIKRTKIGLDDFLILESMLSLDSNMSLKISVQYFVRGARKYFKPAMQQEMPKASCAVKKIGAQEIREFFENVGQGNSFFYDPDLAKLNGRQEIMVPTQALSLWLVQYALTMWPSEYKILTSFRLDFYCAVFADQELSLAREIGAGIMRLALFAGAEVAVILVAK